MQSIYLSPAHPRLALTTEADVVAALRDELLEETHFLELKRELKTGKTQNRETARDMAQFAVDGGTVIVGLEEADGAVVQPAPQPLAGLAERVEQIATTAIDPPLAIVTHSIPTDEDSSHGYLVVHIPVSPSAPHMVDGRYLGRGDKTKRYLTDPEVLRLHAVRSANDLNGLDLLHQEIDRDVFSGPEFRRVHGFYVAQPVTGRPDLMLRWTEEPDYQALLDLVTVAVRDSNRPLSLANQGGFSPDLNDMSGFDRRATGLARSSHGIAPGRVPNGSARTPESAGELELQDNGGVRLYTGRLSDQLSGGTGQMVIDSAIVGLAHRMVALARGVADLTGYFGNWAFAVGAIHLKGTRSYTLGREWLSDAAPYSNDTYEQAVTASYAELTTRPNEIVDALIGGLLRGLQSRKAYLSALRTPIISIS